MEKTLMVNVGCTWHFAMLARAKNADVSCDANRLSLGDEPILLDEEQMLRINYVGPPESFPVHSFRDALEAASGKRSLGVDLAGAMVLIGVTAPSQQDYHATPCANNYWRNLFAPGPG